MSEQESLHHHIKLQDKVLLKNNFFGEVLATFQFNGEGDLYIQFRYKNPAEKKDSLHIARKKDIYFEDGIWKERRAIERQTNFNQGK